ncbi:MAG: carbon storage regulator [Planctomycetaceae bacterium]|nr:carbon storage regulator [Planctomycetaceae bacterium]
MLVLTRKQGESIRIDDEIVVTVIDVRQGRVRIGIEAPKDRRIKRMELDLPLTSLNPTPERLEHSRKPARRCSSKPETASC